VGNGAELDTCNTTADCGAGLICLSGSCAALCDANNPLGCGLFGFCDTLGYDPLGGIDFGTCN
jgi:hypothetical protein